MSQLERQYDELEEVGRNIENALRDAEDSEIYVYMYVDFDIITYALFLLCRCSRGSVNEILARSCERKKWTGQEDS
jgi:hypothetical protein